MLLTSKKKNTKIRNNIVWEERIHMKKIRKSFLSIIIITLLKFSIL